MIFNTRTAAAFAIAAGTLVPSLAQAETVKFDRDGVHYTYKTATQKDATVLSGMADGTTPFRLVVKGDRVTGWFGRSSVDFKVPETSTAVAMR